MMQQTTDESKYLRQSRHLHLMGLMTGFLILGSHLQVLTEAP